MPVEPFHRCAGGVCWLCCTEAWLGDRLMDLTMLPNITTEQALRWLDRQPDPWGKSPE